MCDYEARQLSGMTHLEPFSYPVWDEEKLSVHNIEMLPDEKYILFDYSERDQLFNEARIIAVE